MHFGVEGFVGVKLDEGALKYWPISALEPVTAAPEPDGLQPGDMVRENSTGKCGRVALLDPDSALEAFVVNFFDHTECVLVRATLERRFTRVGQKNPIVIKDTQGPSSEPPKPPGMHPSEVNHESISSTMGRGFPCWDGVPEPVMSKEKAEELLIDPRRTVTHLDRNVPLMEVGREEATYHPKPVESVNPFELADWCMTGLRSGR